MFYIKIVVKKVAFTGIICWIANSAWSKKLFKYNILYSFIFRYQKFMWPLLLFYLLNYWIM